MKKFSFLIVAGFFSLPLLFSCNNSAKTTSPESKQELDLTTAKGEIEEANRNFMDVLSKGDSVALADCYATDAKFMAPNSPAVEGRKNIQSVLAAGIINAGVASVDLTTVNVWGNEAMLAEEGALIMTGKGGKELDKGKYIVLWKKEDGKWKLFRDCFNSDLPAVSAK